jgi:hypothetical protein
LVFKYEDNKIKFSLLTQNEINQLINENNSKYLNDQSVELSDFKNKIYFELINTITDTDLKNKLLKIKKIIDKNINIQNIDLLLILQLNIDNMNDTSKINENDKIDSVINKIITYNENLKIEISSYDFSYFNVLKKSNKEFILNFSIRLNDMFKCIDKQYLNKEIFLKLNLTQNTNDTDIIKLTGKNKEENPLYQNCENFIQILPKIITETGKTKKEPQIIKLIENIINFKDKIEDKISIYQILNNIFNDQQQIQSGGGTQNNNILNAIRSKIFSMKNNLTGVDENLKILLNCDKYYKLEETYNYLLKMYNLKLKQINVLLYFINIYKNIKNIYYLNYINIIEINIYLQTLKIMKNNKNFILYGQIIDIIENILNNISNEYNNINNINMLEKSCEKFINSENFIVFNLSKNIIFKIINYFCHILDYEFFKNNNNKIYNCSGYKLYEYDSYTLISHILNLEINTELIILNELPYQQIIIEILNMVLNINNNMNVDMLLNSSINDIKEIFNFIKYNNYNVIKLKINNTVNFTIKIISITDNIEDLLIHNNEILYRVILLNYDLVINKEIYKIININNIPSTELLNKINNKKLIELLFKYDPLLKAEYFTPDIIELINKS